MSIKAGQLRRDIDDIISDQPIVINRYVMLLGDGVDTGNSWSWAGSWVGRKDQMGSNVWWTQRNVLGEQTRRTYNLLFPWEAGGKSIGVGDRVELSMKSGTSLGVFILIWVEEFYDSSGNVWKVEANCEEYQG